MYPGSGAKGKGAGRIHTDLGGMSQKKKVGSSRSHHAIYIYFSEALLRAWHGYAPGSPEVPFIPCVREDAHMGAAARSAAAARSE